MKKSVLLLSLMMMAACAHHRDVRPGVNGVHRVALKGEEAESEGSNAMAQANHYCEQFGKQAAVVDENSKYTGNMSESSYKNTKTAAKVAGAVGGTLAIFGGQNERNVGRVGLLGGIGANALAGEGYSYQMRFKCLK